MARDQSLGDTIPLKIMMLTDLGQVWGKNGAVKGSAGQNWSAADLERYRPGGRKENRAIARKYRKHCAQVC